MVPLFPQEMASPKSLVNILTFTFGSAIGFFLCYLLFNLRLDEQIKVEPHILHNDPHGHHSDNDENNNLKGQMNFNADAGQHKGIYISGAVFFIFLHHKYHVYLKDCK